MGLERNSAADGDTFKRLLRVPDRRRASVRCRVEIMVDCLHRFFRPTGAELSLASIYSVREDYTEETRCPFVGTIILTF
jgi:hypothetical protein